MRKSKPLWILTSSIVFILLAVLALLVRYHMQQPELAYDPRPTNVVIYADLRGYPSAPPPNKACLGQFYPRLPTWGDSLVFLDRSQAKQEEPGQWRGHLTQAQLQSAVETLNTNGFSAA
jgi:hypothetical protein